jgi:hypothetical protein
LPLDQRYGRARVKLIAQSVAFTSLEYTLESKTPSLRLTKLNDFTTNVLCEMTPVLLEGASLDSSTYQDLKPRDS